MKYPFLFFLCCAWLAFLPCSASQSPNNGTTSDTIDLGTVVVTAQFVPSESRQTVNSVRIIDQKTIENKAAVNLTELLQTEANLRIGHDAILGSNFTVNGLRAENVKILVDGVPVVGRLDGSIDAGQLPLNAVRQVEIIEGAQSLVYGSEASAGVINLLTKQSQAHLLEADATGLIESNGYRSANARAGARVGKFFVQANGGLLEFVPQKDSTERNTLWNSKEQKNARALIRYSPGDQLDLRLSGNFFSEKVTNLGEQRRPQFKPYAFDDYYYTDRSDVNLSGSGWAKKDLYWQATAAWNSFGRRKNSWRYEFEEKTKELIEGEQDTSSADGYLLRATLASDRRGKKWDYMLGAEHFTETAEGVRIVDSSENHSGFAKASDLGIFGSLKYRPLPSLTLQGGARFTYNNQYGSALTPALWTAWRPTKSWEIKASYSNGFRSPGLKERYFNFIDVNHYIVGNMGLKPERSHNLRAEIKQSTSIRGDWLLDLSLSGFYNHVNDRIILAEFAPVQYQYDNLAKWRTTGTGFSVGLKKGSILRFCSAIVATGYFNTLSEEAGEVPSLSWSPDWVNDLGINLFKGRAGFTVWHKRTGRTPFFFNEDGKIKEGETESWNLLNASVNGNFWENRVRLTAGVKNILDVRQVRSGSVGGSHTGSGEEMRPAHWGRSFFLQTQIAFHTKK